MGNVPHTHTDECWEPDSGCDMGRNEKYARAVPRDEILPSNPVTLEYAKDFAAMCRKYGRFANKDQHCVVVLADEIERLTREYDKLLARDTSNLKLLIAAQAERDRLLAALQRIAHGGVTDCMIAQDIAANALDSTSLPRNES